MTTINKPLPHRPFSLAGDSEKAPRRQQAQMTSVSNLRPPYVPAHDKFMVPPVPKRNHLVTRSPSPPYYLAVAPATARSDALPSSRPRQPPHSFSQSQSRSIPHSSTSNLVPSHLKPTRTNSFWRRHWNRIARICHQFDSQASRNRLDHPDCAWTTAVAFRRAQ
jgi:hypothetical protein